MLLKELDALPLAERSALVVDEHRKLTQYVRNNQYRMDYLAYMANGWEIGSGEIESACEHVANRRLCSAGMRWRSPGTTELCHLRALYRSEPPSGNTSTDPAVDQLAGAKREVAVVEKNRASPFVIPMTLKMIPISGQMTLK